MQECRKKKNLLYLWYWPCKFCSMGRPYIRGNRKSCRDESVIRYWRVGVICGRDQRSRE